MSDWRKALSEARHDYRDRVRDVLNALTDEELHEIVGFSEPDVADYARFRDQAEKAIRVDAAVILARRARAVRAESTLDAGGVWCVYHDRDFSTCPRCTVCAEHLAADGDEHRCVIPS